MPHAPDDPPRPNRAWQIPFSGMVWSSAFGVMLGTSLVSAVRKGARTPAEQSLWSAKAFSKVLKVTGCTLTIEYDERFDRERTSVFCQNHVNVMDAHMACRVIPQPFVGMMLAWHFKIPGYGWMMRATNGIPVHPASAGRTKELTEVVRNRVEQGLSILCFPEGHRTLTGKMRKLKRGVFFMARDAGGIPVVPVAVHGWYDVMKKGSMLVTPGEVRVHVGPQIETAGLSDDGIRQLAEVLEEAMNSFIEHGDNRQLSALSDWTP